LTGLALTALAVFIQCPCGIIRFPAAFATLQTRSAK